MTVTERVTKHRQLIYFISGFLLLGTLASAHSFLELRDTPDAYSTAGEVVVINASGDGLAFSDSPQQWVLNSFIDRVNRNLDVHVQGDLQEVATDQVINSSSNATANKGTGKLMIVPLAGTDAVGTITVHGTRVDRDTQERELGYEDNITLNGLCTNTSFTNGGGVVVDRFTDCYLTRHWMVNEINISSSDVDLSQVDLYHVSFEQGNDRPFKVNTADINYYVTNANADIHAYFYVVNVTNRTRVDIYHAGNYTVDDHVAQRYYRGRGAFGLELNGSEDGFYFEFNFLPNNQPYFENIDFKVWGEYT